MSQRKSLLYKLAATESWHKNNNQQIQSSEQKASGFKRGDRIIFDKVNIEIPRGKITAFMGPSGCGKTTMLRLIGGQ